MTDATIGRRRAPPLAAHPLTDHPADRRSGVAPRRFERRRWHGAAAALVALAGLSTHPLSIAADSAADFDWRATVRLQGPGPLHSVVLPEAAYLHAKGQGLSDLRVFNAAGESIPFAIDHATRPAVPATDRAVPAVPLRLNQPAGRDLDWPEVTMSREGSQLRLTWSGAPKAASGEPLRTVAWFFDVHESPGASSPSPVRALVLSLPEGADFQTQVRLEASDDLRQWETLVPAAPLLRAGQGDAAVRHLRIAFEPTTRRYLRMTWPGALGALTITEARVEPAPGPDPREWRRLRLKGQRGSENGEARVTYETPAALPVERVQLVLGQPNSVVPVSIDSHDDAANRWQSRHRATFYRFAAAAGSQAEVSSPEQSLAGAPVFDRRWRIRIDRSAGDLPDPAPELELIWPARRVIFAARGAAPYTVAVGHPRMPAVALTLAALVPDHRPDRPVPASPATLENVLVRRGERPWWDGIDRGQAVMWAALVAAVALLGGLAWRAGRPPSR